MVIAFMNNIITGICFHNAKRRYSSELTLRMHNTRRMYRGQRLSFQVVRKTNMVETERADEKRK